MRSKGSAEELERRRLLAIKRLEDGYTVSQVAAFLGVTARSVERWKAAYVKKGIAALAAKPALGRMPKLTDRQIATVLSWFAKSPREFGFATDLWTSSRVRDLIQQTFHVTFNANYLCRWLANHNITPQKPRRRAYERDDARIQGWLDRNWPALVKKGLATTLTSSSSMKPAASFRL